ncbi:MAG: hypothetical protein M1826_000093 [Phylliscum demangeonii]|nr:MAG: hypothetical protein M1826_000093 [Phylliscum demangeonii]
MSRDPNHPHHPSTPTPGSGSSSPGESIFSGFDPENDAVVSTRQLERSHISIPDSVYASVHVEPNGSPLARFSRHSAASPKDLGALSLQDGDDSDDTSPSIEMGRGGKKDLRSGPTRFRPTSHSSRQSLGLSERGKSSPRAITDALRKTGFTPPRPSLLNPARKDESKHVPKAKAEDDLFAIEDKENQRPPSAEAKAAVDGRRRGTAGSRRTLAEMHARVRDEKDESLLTDERPVTMDLTARSTRFGQAQGRATSADSTRASAPSGKHPVTSRSAHGGQTPMGRGKLNANVAGGTVTEPSYMLPDMPNISDLVSGVYHAETSVGSGRGAAGSRFAPNRVNGAELDEIDHAEINGVPVPSEEKVILVSLRILQDKVAELETERAEAEVTIHELNAEITALKGEQKEWTRRRRSDGASKSDRSVGEAVEHSEKESRKMAAEKLRLEGAINLLEERLAAASRKTSVSNATVKNLTRERDSAEARLGLAYCRVEELVRENQTLSEENENVKQQLAELTRAHEMEEQRWAKKEAAYKKKLGRQNETAHEVREMTRELFDLKQRPAASVGAGSDDHHQQQASRVSEPVREANASMSRLADMGQPRSAPSSKADQSGLKSLPPREAVPKQKKTRKVVVEETVHSDVDEVESVRSDGRGDTDSDSSVASSSSGGSQITYLSFLDPEEVARLRKTLEEERIKRKESRTRAMVEESGVSTGVDDVRSEPSAVSKPPPLVRKSSLKKKSAERLAALPDIAEEEHTGKLSIKTGENTEEISDERSPAAAAAQAASSSGQDRGRTGLRPRRKAENMTSAFLVPDITFSDPLTRLSTQPVAAASSGCALHGQAEHHRANCTVCRRLGHDGRGAPAGKSTIIVPRPIPVSERMPPALPYEDEPTMRPSQPPSVALAVVMKGLEDELAHLKMDLARYQALYDEHDASLRKHQRKALAKKIALLLHAIDTKADQIYALYDVLEGQTADGHVISEQQVEVTLHSLGLDLVDLSTGLAVGTHAEHQAEEEEAWNRSCVDNDDDDEELPWEGIDDTIETTHSRRSGRYA